MNGPRYTAYKDTIERIKWRMISRYRKLYANQATGDLEDLNSASDEWILTECRLLCAKLTPIESQLILDVVVRGFTEQEMAYRLGCSKSWIHKVKVRALSKLRGSLDEREDA